MKKYFNFLIIILAVAVIVPQIALAAWWNPFSWGIWNRIFHFQQTGQEQEQQTKNNEPQIVGGDKDAHGCIPSAGYTWCGAKQKCLRIWEEACEISGDLYPMYSDLKWSAPVSEIIKIPVSNVSLKMYKVKAESTISQNQDAEKMVSYYDKKLKTLGWTDENNFAADGIKGSQRGYKKGGNYIVISYVITPGKIISGENEPLQWECPCGIVYTIMSGGVIKK